MAFLDKAGLERLWLHINSKLNKVGNTTSFIKEASGETITVNDSAEQQLLGLKLYGKTEQNTTTGKNLLPNTVSTTVNNGITFTSNTDGTITANGTSMVDYDAYCIVGTATLEVGKKYLLTGCPSGGGFGIGLDGTGIYDWGDGIEFTAETENYTPVLIVGKNKTISNIVFKPMVRSASVTDATYEPYTGGMASPNPDYPQELMNVGDGGNIGVYARGKNLAEIFSSASVGTKYGTMATIRAFKLFAGITYTLSFDTQNTGIMCYTNPNSLGIYQQFVMDGSRKSFTFCHDVDRDMIIEPDGSSMLVSRFSDTSDVNSGVISNVQIEIGSTATAYEPYKDGGSITINTPNGLPGIPVTSGGNYTDANGQMWVCDEIDFERGVYVQRNMQKVLNGTEDWHISDTTDGKNNRYFLSVSDKKLENNNTEISSILCNAYPAIPPMTGYTGADYGVQGQNDSPVIWINDVRYPNQNLDGFKASLAANPITVIYVLATPIETPLSEAELAAYRAMATQNLTTTIYNDSNAWMEVEYADSRIDEIEEALDLPEIDKTLTIEGAAADAKAVRDALAEKQPVGNYAGSSSADGVATNSYALKSQSHLTTVDAMNEFVYPNELKYATFKLNEDSNNLDFGSNDGMLLSIPWSNDNYAVQLAVDDAGRKMSIRSKGIDGWTDWDRMLSSSNYTDYVTPASIGADASGSANTALTNAKAYTDAEITEWVGDQTVAAQIAAINYAGSDSAGGAATQAIQDASGNVITDTYATKEETKFLDEATGDVVVVNNSAELPLNNLKLYGKTDQFTTTGKNLLNVSEEFTFTERQMITLEEALPPGTYTVSALITSDDTDDTVNWVGFVGGSSDGTNAYVTLQRNTRNSGTITIYKTVATVFFNASSTLAPSEGDTATVYQAQIEAGSTATAYEPYTGGASSPSPDWPQPLVSPGDSGSIGVHARGKNLAPDKAEGYTTDIGTSYRVKLVNPYNKTVTMKITDKNNGVDVSECYIGMVEDPLDAVDISTYIWLVQGGNLTTTETTNTFKYIFIYPNTEEACNKVFARYNVQVEYGDTATAYEPYKDGGSVTLSTPNGLPGIPVSSGGNYTDASGQMWICDEIDLEKGVYIKRTHEIEFDGTTVGHKMDATDPVTANTTSVYAYIIDINLPYSLFSGSKALCNYLAYGKGLATNNVISLSFTREYLGLSASETDATVVTNTINTKLAEFYNAGEPLKVRYILADPIETTLTASELSVYRAMSTQYPTTVIYNDAGADMDIVYATYKAGEVEEALENTYITQSDMESYINTTFLGGAW